MTFRPGTSLFVVGLLAASVFLGLGFWQLDRLEQRRAENRRKRRRMERPPLELVAASFPPAGSLDWRRVVARGRFDYEAEPVDDDTLRATGGAYPVLTRLDLRRVRELLPWRVPGFYVRADSTTARIPTSDGPPVPTPVQLSALDEGPHLAYAIQWFAFAAIVLVGGGLYLAARRNEEHGSRPAGRD